MLGQSRKPVGRAHQYANDDLVVASTPAAKVMATRSITAPGVAAFIIVCQTRGAAFRFRGCLVRAEAAARPGL
jgi:hypothetical protein